MLNFEIRKIMQPHIRGVMENIGCVGFVTNFVQNTAAKEFNDRPTFEK